MAVNIGKANEGDAFYRYKMPALQSKVRERGRREGGGGCSASAVSAREAAAPRPPPRPASGWRRRLAALLPEQP